MDMCINIKIKKVRENAKLPLYATEGSAAVDLCAAIDEPETIEPGCRLSVPTGIAISTGRSDIVAVIAARSGLGVKKGITLANGIGVIDSDYRGEISVGLYNSSSVPFTVNPGDRIAQLMFLPVFRATFTETDELDETERGEGGFGSTGVK